MSTPPDEPTKQQLLRMLPRIDALVAHPRLQEVLQRLGRETLTQLARGAVDEARNGVLHEGERPQLERVAEKLSGTAEALLASRACRVINATGVLLHTNLGRAPLSQAAVDALAASAGGYTSIELDLATGRRGKRGAFAHTALAQLCGAEDALVVNNNAAAVLLVLSAVARGRGVVVSRGEQVEIGGGFRIPDVLARSGARMIEVGTTNRTRLSDYERAIDENDDVAVLLRVHQGNFRQLGFVERPELGALAELAHERGVLLVKDLGGGAMVDLQPYGLRGEPVARECVRAGADLTCFSSDKVLGGPQGGVIVGSAALVAKVRRDPLARALRLGRLPLVALEATLDSYLSGDLDALPTLWALRQPLDAVRGRAAGWCEKLKARAVEASVVEATVAVGGGTLAEQPLASAAVHVHAARPNALAARLRHGEPPVMVRIHEERVLLDARSVRPDEEAALLDAVVAALGVETDPQPE